MLVIWTDARSGKEYVTGSWGFLDAQSNAHTVKLPFCPHYSK